MIDFSAFADELEKIAEFHKGAGLGTTLLGAGIGGVTGAATAPDGQPRWKSALTGAALGGVAGLAGGSALKGAGKNLQKMKVNVAPTQVQTGKRFFGLLPSKQKTVTKMRLGDVGEHGAELALTDPQKAKVLEQAKKGLVGAGVMTAGAAGAGVMGSRGMPYMMGANAPQGYY